jgi:hypothetical protein
MHLVLAEERVRTAAKGAEKKKALEFLADVNETLKKLKIKDPPVVPHLHRFAVGDIGEGGDAKVRQIVDKESVLVEFLNGEGTHLLTGIDPSEFADDQNLDVNWIVHVSKTKQFKTVLGSTRTVFVIERYNPPWEAKEKKKKPTP